MNRSEYEDILKNAIESEIEAQNFYKSVSEKVASPDLKELFSSFVREEKKHQDILEGFLSEMPETLPFDESKDYKVAETVDEIPLTTDLKPADAFALAMKKEEAAMAHYSRLADACTDPAQEKIFHDLAAMEREHKLKMEKAFVDIGYPEVW